MIPPNTVAQILDTAQIEEVVGDFVTLRKRGANYTACCPFHNEKTPSFSVSPAKGIYKCFGCGNAGNVSKFIMEHENLSYPEALRFLAKRYNIEIQEIKTKEAIEEKQERDSLFIVNEYANQHYQHNLLHTDEGKSVGLSYFKERGFTQETIQKFQLGYSAEQYDHLYKSATSKGHKTDYLQKLGLTRQKNGRHYDFFRARVQFPLFNLSGKVIAFAGRTLKQDKKTPKYINSPETEIYQKSKFLYGLYFAKKSIRQKDQCILVEGYTDVISLHQSGIQNVVASSGTSLTTQQIHLLQRFTKNVLILFDGDSAGIKAALRGVDMLLEQDVNVQIAVLPEGHDPDSFVTQEGSQALLQHLQNKAQDFVLFKTQLLLQESQNNPIQKTALTKDLLQSIAKIPDPIKRTLYLKECSRLLEIDQEILLQETNQVRQSHFKANTQAQRHQQAPKASTTSTKKPSPNKTLATRKESHCSPQETELIRVLLNIGDKELEDGVPVSAFILTEIEELPLSLPIHQQITTLYSQELQEGRIPSTSFFTAHANDSISQASANLLHHQEISHNWEKKGIYTKAYNQDVQRETYSTLDAFKMKVIQDMMQECLEKLQNPQTHNLTEIQETYLSLLQHQKEIAGNQRSVIVC